jgi:hypothetical protein
VPSGLLLAVVDDSMAAAGDAPDYLDVASGFALVGTSRPPTRVRLEAVRFRAAVEVVALMAPPWVGRWC